MSANINNIHNNNYNNNNGNNININGNNVNINGSQSAPNIILQTLKRRAVKASVPLSQVVTLEKAFGFTITSNAKLAQSIDGTIAYLAGCVIVLYDTKTFKQDFIVSTARKTLTTLSFSYDGRFIATGESGHDPRVRLWDVKDKIQIAEFSGHKYLIECVCFSPSHYSNLIVSIGSVHDMVVNVWNFKTRFKVASNKIACKVKGIAFSRDGTYFVTVGNRHVKFWFLTTSSLMETVPLKGRSAILSDMKNSNFCDVVCGRSKCPLITFAITSNGVLCEFDENRTLRKVIELRVDRAYCIFVDDDNLYIGCSAGTILIFRQNNLDFVASLPRPHNLGVDISKGLDTRQLIENLNNNDLKYPDCIALCYSPLDYYLCAIYNDHSLYIWDIKDVNKVKKIDSHLFHSSCCWSLDLFPSHSISANFPNDSFITCSNDNTLRIWSLENLVNENLNSTKPNNIYSKELLHMLYIDNDLSGLCDTELITNNQDNNSCDHTSNCNSNSTTNISSQQNSNEQHALNSVKLGARCLKISPFGLHLATGDRNGNIRIYDLKQLESIILIEAHESEILYLQYSQPESGRLLLASSSRDRLIHIFDAKKNYELIQTLDDHSAAITATRFCYNQIEKQFYLISCGSDKSIIFRSAQEIPNTQQSTFNEGCTKSNSFFEMNNSNSSKIQFSRSGYVCEKMTFYDLVVDPTKNYINTVSQDRIVRTYSIKDGKKLRQFKGSLNEDGYLLKMDIDRTGSLLATSCTDKCVYIWDLNSCECLAYLCGHSELIVDLKFTNDNKYLITIGVDSCIFVWKLNILNSNQQHPLNVHRKSQVFVNNSLIPAKSSNDDLAFELLLDNHASSESNESDKLPQSTRSKFDIQYRCDLQIGESKSFDNDNLINNENKKMNNVRRSRAVWGPVCNTSFAVMVDNEIDESTSQTPIKSKEINSEPFFCDKISQKIYENVRSSSSAASSELSLPVVQFPSPNIEKNLYQVVTVDTNINKSRSLCLTIEDSREDDTQDVPSTPTKDKFQFSSPSKVLSNDVCVSHFSSPPNEFDKKPSSSNGDPRRQSLTAKYLMKAQQSNNNTPVLSTLKEPEKNSENEIEFKEQIPAKNEITMKGSSPIVPSKTINILPTNSTTIYSITTENNNKTLNNSIPHTTVANSTVCRELVVDVVRVKKTRGNNYIPPIVSHVQHTESSLCKIKSKQYAASDLFSSKLNKSPSMNSVTSAVESTNGSDEKSPIMSNNLEDENGYEVAFGPFIKSSIRSSPLKVVLNSQNDAMTNSTSTKSDESNNDCNENGSKDGLKKVSSMVSITSATAPTPMTSSSSFNSKPICSVNNHVNKSKTFPVNTNSNGNQITNNNNSALPPKTVRQVKQSSRDRHQNQNQNINTNTEKNGSLDKNHIRKLSNSVQNLQSIPTTIEAQPNKRPQRNSFYCKNPRKQRSNTEELITTKKHNDDGDEIKTTESENKTTDIEKKTFEKEKHDCVKTEPELKNEKDGEIFTYFSKASTITDHDEEKLWKEFNKNLGLLGSINQRVLLSNPDQKTKRKQLLETFNRQAKTFLVELDLVEKKQKI